MLIIEAPLPQAALTAPQAPQPISIEYWELLYRDWYMDFDLWNNICTYG
jgi:hypothetical protein